MNAATEVKNIDPSSEKRRWCFTWNNPPTGYETVGSKFSGTGQAELLPSWQVILKRTEPRYYVVGYEIAPTTGTPHLQGYVEFRSGKRLRTLHDVCKEIHWDACKGDQASNIKYCTKGGVFCEWGEKGEQGKRTDLTEIRDTIANGGTMLDVAEQNFGSYVRYHRGFERYQYLIEQQSASQWRDVRVSYYWGDSGTGKSRAAWDEDRGLFAIPDSNTGTWWTGYTNQKTVLLDDFRGTVPLHTLLKWLDGYPVQVPIHGGMTWLKATRIIITSNVPIESLYQNCDERSKQALRRRIHEVRFFEFAATEATGNTRTVAIIENLREAF